MARYVTLEVTDTKSVKLRMSIGDMVNFEKALGNRPVLSIFSKMSSENDLSSMPTARDITLAIHYSLQSMEHGYDFKKTEALINEYLQFEGEDAETGEEIDRSIFDLIPIILEVFQVSGVIPKTKKVDPNDVADEVEDPNV